MDTIIISLVVLGGTGALCGILLAVASRVFAVKTDPRIEVIEELLPGANCAGCGFPSCHAYAQNMVEGGVEPNRCVLCSEKAVEEIGKVLGIEVSAAERKVAAINCCGGRTSAKRFEYAGIPTCRAASLFGGGDSLCEASCLGFGDCALACPFAAITRSPERATPLVDLEKCTGCGNCVRACPKQVVALIPKDSRMHVGCNSTEKGKLIRQICEVGCIKCRRCIKVCPEEALSMQENGLVLVEYQKCTGCGQCIEECPRKIIVDHDTSSGEAKAANQ